MGTWRKRRTLFWALFAPGTLWLVVFFTLPLLLVALYSVSEQGDHGETILAPTLENYLRAFEWAPLGILWKSLWIAVSVTAVCLVMGFPLALGIAFAPRAWKTPLLALVALPFWTNLLIRTYAWIAVLRTKGHLNDALGWMHAQINATFATLGLPDALGPFVPLELLYNDWAVIIALVHIHLPFMVLPLYAVLEKLDRAHLEASLDLGAGHWRTFRSVIVPLAMPGLVTGSVLVFILALGNFVAADLLGGSDSMMIGNLIAQQFGPSDDWPYGSALSLLLLYATFLFLWLRALSQRRREAWAAA
ncbi:MAG: ABC transporter permease [Alphaproteobacteria bacterium]